MPASLSMPSPQIYRAQYAHKHTVMDVMSIYIYMEENM